MAEHTKLPWKQRATYVYSPFGNVCVCGEPRAQAVVGYTELAIGSNDTDEAFANAELIVRACNNHAALVDALERASRRLDAIADGAAESHMPGLEEQARAWAEEARVALKAAKEFSRE